MLSSSQLSSFSSRVDGKCRQRMERGEATVLLPWNAMDAIPIGSRTFSINGFHSTIEIVWTDKLLPHVKIPCFAFLFRGNSRYNSRYLFFRTAHAKRLRVVTTPWH